MNIFENALREEDIDVTSLAWLVRSTGRNVLSIESDHLWVEGNECTNIQIGHVKNKQSICVFAGRPIPKDRTEAEYALLANRLNADFDVARFYVRFSETANQYVLLVDHYIFYGEALIKSHFLMSLQFVEYFAMQLDLSPYVTHSRAFN